MTSQADGALAFALAQVGKPYKFGAAGPNEWDCSGLVSKAYASVGITLPHSTYMMVTLGKEVPLANIAPGDVIFPHAGHCQMWVGAGKIVEAPTTGIPVRVVPEWGGYWHIRRYASTPGTGSATATGTLTSVTGAVSDAANIVTGTADTITQVGKVFAFLGDKNNWLRLAEFSAGLALIGWALLNTTEGLKP